MISLSELGTVAPWFRDARHEGSDIAPAVGSPIDIWVAWADDGEVAGWVGLLKVATRRWNIRGWYVRPEYRRQGYGRALLEQAQQVAQAAGVDQLEIRTAHEWVTRLGFLWTGVERVGGNQERRYLWARPL